MVNYFNKLTSTEKTSSLSAGKETDGICARRRRVSASDPELEDSEGTDVDRDATTASSATSGMADKDSKTSAPAKGERSVAIAEDASGEAEKKREMVSNNVCRDYGSGGDGGSKTFFPRYFFVRHYLALSKRARTSLKNLCACVSRISAPG